MQFIEVSNYFKNNENVLFYVLGECTDNIKSGITTNYLKNLKKNIILDILNLEEI